MSEKELVVAMKGLDKLTMERLAREKFQAMKDNKIVGYVNWQSIYNEYLEMATRCFGHLHKETTNVR